MGHGWPFETTLGTAAEGGESERSEDPDVGGPSFAYFSWASKKSEAPGGAQQKLTIKTDNQLGTRAIITGFPIREHLQSHRSADTSSVSLKDKARH